MKQFLFLLGCSILLAGCGATLLVVESNFDVPIEGKAYGIDPIGSQQTVKVTAKATGGPIHVIVCRDADKAAVETELLAGKLKIAVLAQQLNTEDASLQATVPANTTAMVLIHRAGIKEAKVKMKITNR